ncbi:MAG: DUF1080 domain-containing protein [Planctomycetota bacterium]|nr:MAG: DUF1080 domain-containing protein [Planctomycetota bacterium]
MRRLLALCSLLAAVPALAQGVGYTDTPKLPGQPWRVHDKDRPNPPVVDPGPAPKTIAPPPSDAVVLFDGTNLDAWQHASGQSAKWELVGDQAMQVRPGTGDIQTRESFGDVQLHLEFATPAEVESSSQGRGNSGVFFFGRYEIQILDSYDNKTYADGQAAALYGQWPPLVNASRKPGEWQTYDIIFEAPRFDENGKLERPAYVTMFHNGVLVHNHRAMLGATRHRDVATYAPHGPTGPIKLQDHGNPMRFRNIWVRPLDLDGPAGDDELDHEDND